MNNVLVNDFNIIGKTVEESEKFFGSRWLLTGATGLIGSYLLCFLSWLNETRFDGTMQFTVLSRGPINREDPMIGHLLMKKYITFVQKDLSEEFMLDSCDYDYVFHAASNASPAKYVKDPIGTINTNIRATQILLESFKGEAGLKRFMYVSSGEIYGSPDLSDVPTKETYICKTDHLSSRSCYVESKRYAETLCINYYNTYKIPVTIIRPVHIYGPGFKEDDTRVWADFIKNAIRCEDIRILSDGLSQRGFCYISDAVSQIMVILQKGSEGEAYNIGNSNAVTIRDLAETIKRYSGNNIGIIVERNLPDYLKMSPFISCPDVSKIRSLSSQIICTDLDEGIKRIFEFYSKERSV